MKAKDGASPDELYAAPLLPQAPQVHVQLGLLKSYANMGCLRVECPAKCRCEVMGLVCVCASCCGDDRGVAAGGVQVERYLPRV